MNDESCPLSLQSPIFDAFCRSVDKQYIYICDVKTNIWRWSPYSVDYFNLPGELIKNLPDIWLERVHPDDRERLAGVFGELFSGESDQHSCEYRVKNADNVYVWVLCRGCMVYDENDNMSICAGIITDLGQNNKFDSVTGLFSMHEFQRKVKKYIVKSDAKGGILLIGIDHFRRLNESKNFSFGNAILFQYAKKLLGAIPETVQLFRMDGDKFAFIYQNADRSDLEKLFREVSEIAQDGMNVQGERIPFAVSGGAVLYPENGVASDELYTSLEYALESSKKSNREGLTFFTEHLQSETVERFHFQQKIKESVKNNFEGFYLCYQPTVTADKDHILSGAEALLRWFHPDFGLVSPVAFIPILEESGDIVAVGKWVLSTALKQAKQWHVYKPDMKISVNVSLIQLMDKSFRHYVLNEINACDFPKQQLILELTESCNVLHPDEIRGELNFFRQNGIQIALDDFGTGYASLSVLRDLTADWIKVDHSFVAQIAENDFDQALTESLINLCKKLELNVCVEGIETEAIENVIHGYTPTVMQGYLYSKPLETKQFEAKYILSE